MTAGRFYSERVGAALQYAAELHATQGRKGRNGEPYLSHLLLVAALVMRYGGSEDQLVAGVLHDGPEDHGGEPRLHDIGQKFGPQVERIVKDCSDSLQDDREAKDPWRTRKADHLRHVTRDVQPDSALVAMCDKVANLTDVVDDYNSGGEKTFERFKGKAVGTRAYYAAMLSVLSARLDERNEHHQHAVKDFTELLQKVDAEPTPDGEDPVEEFLERTAALDDVG